MSESDRPVPRIPHSSEEGYWVPQVLSPPDGDYITEITVRTAEGNEIHYSDLAAWAKRWPCDWLLFDSRDITEGGGK